MDNIINEVYHMLQANYKRFDLIRDIKLDKNSNTILLNCNVGKVATIRCVANTYLVIKSDDYTKISIKTILETLLKERRS